jgi:hypothetical protein
MTATTLAIAADIARGPGPEALAAIARPGNAAALWERRLPPSFAAWMDALPDAALPALRVAADPKGLLAALREAASACSDDAWRDFLLADILDLAARFARILGSPTLRLRLRLEAIDDDACRRFHVDRVRARLLCTYRGAGTELAHPAPAGQAPEPLERLASGTAAIVRGTLWPAREAPASSTARRPSRPATRRAFSSSSTRAMAGAVVAEPCRASGTCRRASGAAAAPPIPWPSSTVCRRPCAPGSPTPSFPGVPAPPAAPSPPPSGRPGTPKRRWSPSTCSRRGVSRAMPPGSGAPQSRSSPGASRSGGAMIDGLIRAAPQGDSGIPDRRKCYSLL